MKVGILTVHRAINMGAVLQCYALQELLRAAGHDAFVIDYVQEKVERTDRPVYCFSDWINLLKGFHLRSVLYYGKTKRGREAAYARFDDFLNKYLNRTAECDADSIPQDFDAYIIGSDQLWNSNIFGYAEDVFWGNFPHSEDSRIVAYAPSTSVKNLKTLPHDYVQKSLNNFSAISLREDSVTQYINANFSLKDKAVTVLDPTIATNPDVWKNIPQSERWQGKDYIFAYAARPYPSNPNIMTEKAKDLAKQLNCDIVSLDLNRHSPVDFINIIRNAKYIITSSFHGVAFSLILNRPLFAVMYGDEQDSRYVNLLHDVGADQMLLGVNERPVPRKVDYAPINAKMDALRMKSHEYLTQALSF